MKKYRNQPLVFLLCAAIAFSLFGCSDQKESSDSANLPSAEQTAPADSSDSDAALIAERFAKVWEEKWASLQQEGTVSNGTGYSFLADMDNDNAPELIFLYNNDVNYDGIIYRLDKEKIEELGSFRISHTEPVLSFGIYQSENGVILKNVAVRPLADSTETEESYITVEDSKVLQEILFSTTYESVDTYYDSILAGAKEISLEEFNQMREDILSGAKETASVFLEPEDSVNCSDPNAVAASVQSLLQNQK